MVNVGRILSEEVEFIGICKYSAAKSDELA
jgi:hypothetical protein